MVILVPLSACPVKAPNIESDIIIGHCERKVERMCRPGFYAGVGFSRENINAVIATRRSNINAASIEIPDPNLYAYQVTIFGTSRSDNFNDIGISTDSNGS